MRVLVLGGGGAVGRAVALALSAYPEISSVVVADRDAEAAARVAAEIGSRARSVEVDVTENEALAWVLRDVDAAVNTTGPFFRFGVPIARAAISAKVHLVDVADDPEPTRDVLALNEEAMAAGITYIVGLGASPGVTNLLARAGAEGLDEVTSIITGWDVTSAAGDLEAPVDDRPSAALVHWIAQLTGRIPARRDGVDIDDTPLREVVLAWPDAEEPVATYTVGHPEPVTLARAFPKLRDSVNVMSLPPGLLEVLQAVSSAVDQGAVTIEEAARELLDMLTGAPGAAAEAQVPALPPVFAQVVGRRGAQVERVSLSLRGHVEGGMAEATGIPAAIGVRLLAQGRLNLPGVHAPEAAVPIEEFFALLAEYLPGDGPAVVRRVDVIDGDAVAGGTA